MNQKGVVVLVSISVVIVLIMSWVSFLPKVIVLDTVVCSKKSRDTAESFFLDSENWKQFLFWSEERGLELPERFMQNGPTQGEGAGFKWFDKKQGDGALEILGIKNGENNVTIDYQLVTGNGQFRERGIFIFSDENEADSICNFLWSDTLDLSTNFAARLAADKDGFSEKMTASNAKVLTYLETLIK